MLLQPNVVSQCPANTVVDVDSKISAHSFFILILFTLSVNFPIEL
ncbi:hypothetical protein VCR20J5_210379 [Vibrio crassostreae]|nr:hypothetical protein VCR15J5_480142 [Vibrio crassostreae]CDT33675.1 hypothetical protein VCR20J5_210379 [Vibrio crassostreae]